MILNQIKEKLENDPTVCARGAERFVRELESNGFDFDNMTTVSLFEAVGSNGHDLRDCEIFNCVTKIDSARL